MLTEIIMPKAGSEMEEGQIVKWLKKEGDKVSSGEIILEIMTDKVNMEIEAEATGTLLKIVKGDGEIVPVITTIGYIGEEGDEIPAEVKEEKKEVENLEKLEEIKEIKEEVKKEKTSNAEYDIVVIGCGPAGYYSAIKASQNGAKVAICEKNSFGGTCLNRGCIPTKTYLQTVEDVKRISGLDKRGVLLYSEVKFDFSKAVKSKNAIVKKLTAGVEFLLKSNGVKIFKEMAYINANGNVLLESGKELTTDKVIYAGGSKCKKAIKGADAKNVFDTDEALDLKEIPSTITIIGASYIGVEMAQIFSTFGAKVVVVEKENTILNGIDIEISSILQKSLEKDGIKFVLGTEITEIKGNEVLANDSVIAESEVILLTTRETDLSALKDISLDLENGNVKVNANMLSSNGKVYAVGDVNGKHLLAHSAFKMGEISATEITTGKAEKFNDRIIPKAIHTYPEIGSVGLTEEDAKKLYDIKVGSFAYGANGRALAHGDTQGMVKVISDAKYGEILGAHIIGPRASELVNEVSILMQAEITVDEAIKMVFGHPTFSEGIYEAIADIKKLSVHIPKK